MKTKNALIALVAALALVLAPSAAAVVGDGGATATSSGKKKGKARGCKSKGKKKGGKSRGCKGKGGSAAGKLANGNYTDAKGGVKLKVTGNGGRIQLTGLVVEKLCIPLEVSSDHSVPLKPKGGSLVATESFTRSGGAIQTLDWSIEIDPDRLRYQLSYDLTYEIPSPEAPVRCEASDKISGTLSR